MKTVWYNGGKNTLYKCSDPVCLKKGKAYDVVGIMDYKWQINYALEGVEGEFNSVWFSETDPNEKKGNVNIVKPVFLAIANSIPKEEENFHCNKLERGENGEVFWVPVVSNKIIRVDNLGNSVYRVETRENIYLTHFLEG